MFCLFSRETHSFAAPEWARDASAGGFGKLQARDSSETGVRAARAQWTIAARRRIAVINLRHLAQFAIAERLQFVSAWTSIHIPLQIVTKLVLAEEPVADRRATLRLWHVRRQSSLLAGRDVFRPEITLVGDDIGCLDIEDFPR